MLDFECWKLNVGSIEFRACGAWCGGGEPHTGERKFKSPAEGRQLNSPVR